MAPPTAEEITKLNRVSDALVRLITDLVTHLEGLDFSSSTETDPAHSQLASVSLSYDSASLIKAHSTKLSLLIINAPFTPSAIIKVLQELLEAAIPSLASAASACEPTRYTKAFSTELRFRCRRVLRYLRDLVFLIPRDGKVLEGNKKDGGGGKGGCKGSIVATSVVWEACDDVMKLRTLGVRGLLAEKVNQQRAILEDIREELKEWKEENGDVGSDDEEGDGTDFDDGFGVNGNDPQAQLDELMSAQRIPKDRTDIRNQLGPCISRLGLLSLLYKAIAKRRIKELPNLPPPVPSSPPAAESSSTSTTSPTPASTTIKEQPPKPSSEEKDREFHLLTVVSRVNEVYPVLKTLPDEFGELVAAFYKLDAPLVETTRAQCFRQACEAGELLRKPWAKGEERDGFSDWLDRFREQMDWPLDPES